MKTVVFLNNKGGVGKTSLVYHLAWMFADQGVKILAVDLDPQANLTAMFLKEERLEVLWSDDEYPGTVYKAVQPILEGIGYIVLQHGILDNRPVRAYQRWMDRIPRVYREAVLEETPPSFPKVTQDPYCLALLKHYRSLMPMAMEARKPIFFLKSADGAIGAHMEAVKSCYDDFLKLAGAIASCAGIAMG